MIFMDGLEDLIDLNSEDYCFSFFYLIFMFVFYSMDGIIQYTKESGFLQ